MDLLIFGFWAAARDYSAAFFHFRIFVRNVPKGATVFTWMNLYTSHTAVDLLIFGFWAAARDYSAAFFHFRIFVRNVPKGATVFTWMNLYTSHTAVFVASSAHFRIWGRNSSSSVRESIMA